MKYSYEYKKDCVELYRHGKWPETPEGVSPDRFHHAVVEWNRLEKTCGLEALQHMFGETIGKLIAELKAMICQENIPRQL